MAAATTVSCVFGRRLGNGDRRLWAGRWSGAAAFVDGRPNPSRYGGQSGGLNACPWRDIIRKQAIIEDSGGGGRTRTYQGLASGFTVFVI
jgi:hypothetical protein